jgi:PPOX class probable F420-dependent enzyme
MPLLNDRQRALFERPNYATVCTIARDGSPRSTTVWCHLGRDEVVELNSRQGRGWPANLARDPRVAISVFDCTDPLDQVNISGHVIEITTDGAQAHVNMLANKYDGADFGVREGETRVLIRVAIDSVNSWA